MSLVFVPFPCVIVWRSTNKKHFLHSSIFICFSYEELEQMQNYSGSVKYEGYKHPPSGETVFGFI